MTVLVVPALDDPPLPTLGPQVCDFLEDRAVFGPGSLKGQPVELDAETRALVYRAYEVWPQGHPRAGRRRFSRVGISLRKGSAKCLDGSVLLTMADGSRRRADQVQPGDRVLSWDGNRLTAADVAQAWEQPPAPRYRITTQHGRELIVTGDHPFLVQGGRWEPGMPARRRYLSCDPDAARTQWVKAEELRDTDRLVTALGWADGGDGGLDPDTAWLLGAIVGDGSGDGRFTNADPEVLDRLRQHYPLSPLRADRYAYYLRGVRPLLRAHGLLGCGARTKTVPAAVYTGGRDVIAAFLAGYLDTDGHVNFERSDRGKVRVIVEWGSVNRALLVECQHLLTGLGVNATLRVSRSRYKGEPYASWKLVVSDRDQATALAETLPVVLPRKRRALDAIRGHAGRCSFAGRDYDRVRSVERLDDGPSYAVEVAGTHTHVTAGLITHNTEKLGWLAYAELHPDGPVRFDGWDANGNPVGRPVRDPYIPLVAYTQEQVEELAFGVLYVVVTEGPDADLFDAGLDRIIRLDARGRADGRAVPLAGSPGARDGARTTFQGFDEPLALATPVPTPDGWTTIGDLTAGDEVLGVDGRPVVVLGRSPIRHDRPCYRVSFTDGTSVVTDAAHRWLATDRRAPHRGDQTVTTEQMAEEAIIGSWATSPMSRWSVPAPAAFDLKPTELPVDPYVLGVWLGDGDSSGVTICQGHPDYGEMVALVQARGYWTTDCATDGKAPRFVIKGLRGQLRALGVFGNKHIPQAYLRASLQQRGDLLAGLMDTDGHVTPGGWCAFVSGRHALAVQVAELARTLGYRVTVNSVVDLRAKEGRMWKVSFQAHQYGVPFRLTRKADRCLHKKAARQTRRSVIAIEPVASVPVRCIGVDSEDHLFLVGDGMVPTHNTHRMVLPNQLATHETMLNNLPKRPLDDPWSAEITTAGQPGQGCVAEKTHSEALLIERGQVERPELFYFHREAGPGHDLTTHDGRVAAIREASGPVADWSDLDGIAAQWDRPGADRSYLERVWTNRWIRQDAQAFDPKRWADLARHGAVITPGSLVTAGFDGARFRDATALVVTDVASGLQVLWGLWECPAYLEDGSQWEVPVAEVAASVEQVMDLFDVWRLYADPAHWIETVGHWSARWPDRVEEWWTNNPKRMAQAVRAYREAMDAKQVTNTGDPDFARHIANAGRKNTRLYDDDGLVLFVLRKLHEDRKFDAGMAGCLSWQARLDAIREGALTEQDTFVPYRIR